MDKNIMKVILVLMMSLLLTNCGSKYYKIEQENQKVLNKVPKWYMSNYSEKKACNTATFGKGKDKMCIFGVGTAVSPDLNLAIEKAMMIAKANLADIVKGEMNKESKQFITELGKSETKTVVSEVESVIVNSIKNTPVRGYEVWEQEVNLTGKKYYRAWVGLRLPLGEYNKMYDYAIADVVDSYSLKQKSKESWDKLMEKSDDKKL